LDEADGLAHVRMLGVPLGELPGFVLGALLLMPHHQAGRLNARQVHESEKSLYFDDGMHPGMDTALEIVSSFAESFYLYTVTMMDHRSDICTALGKGR